MKKDAMIMIRIKREVEEELDLINRVIREYAAVPTNIENWIQVRTKASLLHDFYTGMERIFSRIASELNGGLPNTPDWHRDLLVDMSLELDDIRPPVISRDLGKKLVPYLRFRHLFRNLYSFELEWNRMTELSNSR
ncbi:MAG: hypothetical protein ACLFST_14460 [Spirochaetia bacterium]